MPRASRTCSTCPNIIQPNTGSRCPTCVSAADKQRKTNGDPYSTPGHRAFRRAVLQRDPICTHPDGCQHPSTVADHHPTSRRDLKAAGLNPDNPAAGRGLCKRHHDRHTATTQPGGWNVRIGGG